MNILISPAKKMKEGSLPYESLPLYLEQADVIMQNVRKKSLEELQNMWHCSPAIAKKNQLRFQTMNLQENLMPAIQRYVGLQFQYLEYGSMREEARRYIHQNLKILSAFYGILKPMDGIVSYRMDYLSEIVIDDCKDLYAYWKDTPAKSLKGPVVNLSSQEYAKSVAAYLDSENVVDILFLKKKGNRFVQQSTFAKMARGRMVRYMAENQVQSVNELKNFGEMGLRYDSKQSTEHKLVFLQAEE